MSEKNFLAATRGATKIEHDKQQASNIDTVVIGGGQAGLCMSYALQEEGREHIVLEKGRLLEQWHSKRWDNFMVNTPQKYTRLLGQQDDLPDTQMGVSLEKTMETWKAHIQNRKFPVREQTEVVSVEQGDNNDFIVKVKGNDGPSEYRARNVIAAPGNYQLPNIPDCASRLGKDIKQLRVGTYTNASALPDGAILIVGGGQTGMQIGEVLLKAGRKVFIAASKVKGAPRSYRGEDLFFWMDRIGLLQMPPQALPDPKMKYDRIPIVGNDHPISHHSLSRLGAHFLGGLKDILEDGSTALFRDNLQENIAFAQDGYDFIGPLIEDWINENGGGKKFPPHTPEPEWKPHQALLDFKAPEMLDLKESEISTVLWATGWSADLSWLRIAKVREELGPHGRPESCESCVPGLYWLGFHWLRSLNSGNGYGFHSDAPYIATKLR